MRYPLSSVDIFKERRQKLINDLKDHEAIILPSQPTYYRQPDVPYPFRQNSFFYYLTGFEEPHSCLVLRKKPPAHILFVQEKDKDKEKWDGSRFGPAQALEFFKMDQCEKISQFEKKIVTLLSGISSIYYIKCINFQFNRQLDQFIKKTKKKYLILDIKNKISSMRMLKSEHEIEKIEKACLVSKKAHIAVMKAVHSGVNERTLHGVFLQSIMDQNCERESYTGIFASGENALILHYTDNNQPCRTGDLVLVDAGAEWEYYASDITRTFPVNGKFSHVQKVLYNHVLHVQKKIIDMIRPGVSLLKIQKQTQQFIFECLREENILHRQHKVKDVRSFFPHHFGHFLGLDVHDVNSKTFPKLEPGMVLTVEPGIYLPKEENVPEKFQGIGIRIEDDILVTKDGCKNLSQSIPKEISDIEAVMNS